MRIQKKRRKRKNSRRFNTITKSLRLSIISSISKKSMWPSKRRKESMAIIKKSLTLKSKMKNNMSNNSQKQVQVKSQSIRSLQLNNK